MTTPGQPCSATVTFRDEAVPTPQLVDPFEVKFTVTGPGSVGSTVYKVGTDPNATRVSQGVYTVTFTPTRGGLWAVDADGFDGQGRSIEATEGTILIANRTAPIPAP